MKIDKRIIIKILPVVIFFVLIGLVMFFIEQEHKPIDPDALPKYDNPISEVSIVSEGDIYGGCSELKVERKGSTAVIVSKVIEKTGYPEKVQKYIVTTEVLDKLEEMFYNQGMIEWEKNDINKFSSSDSVGYTFVFKFGTEFSKFTSSQIPSRNSSLSEILALIEMYETNENSEADIMDIFNEDGLYIYGLKNGYLVAEINNNDSSDVAFSTAFELLKNIDGEWVTVIPFNDYEPTEFVVPALSQILVEFDLNIFGKLESGNYKLSCGKVFAEFSIG